MVVEARPGASGATGTGYLAQQPGNGCHMLVSWDTHAVNPALLSLSFDTATAFKAVILVGTLPNMIAVHPSQPWKTLDEMMKDAKEKGSIAYATGGSGTVAHLTMKILEQLYGVEMRHVPYKGGLPAAQDLIGGHVPSMIGSVMSLGPSVRGDKARGIVQTGATRHPMIPDVPTMAELGHANFNITAWSGVFVPASTPDAVVARLNAELVAALQEPVVRERMASFGIQIAGSTPQEADAFVKGEMARWSERHPPLQDQAGVRVGSGASREPGAARGCPRLQAGVADEACQFRAGRRGAPRLSARRRCGRSAPCRG